MIKYCTFLAAFFTLTLCACSAEHSATINSDSCIAKPRKEVMCTTQYQPVCGCDQKTYSNACEADAVDIHVTHEGECTANSLT
jgi:hypothetical protein